MKREPYTGPVIDLSAALQSMDVNKSGVTANAAGGDQQKDAQFSQFHHRPPTSSGSRNMQDSSFSLSGESFNQSCTSNLIPDRVVVDAFSTHWTDYPVLPVSQPGQGGRYLD